MSRGAVGAAAAGGLANVYLTGLRGVGKTTVAQLLAARLGPPWRWCDLDDRVSAAAGASIAEIFARFGESAFRDLEAAALARVAAEGGWVVATGGGVVLRPENRTLLAAGRTAWLTAGLDILVRRLHDDPRSAATRPPLTALAPRDELARLLANREPLYREVAAFACPTDTLAPAAVADCLAGWLAGGTAAAGDVG